MFATCIKPFVFNELVLMISREEAEFTSIGDSGGRLAMTHFDRLSETCLFPA